MNLPVWKGNGKNISKMKSFNSLKHLNQWATTIGQLRTQSWFRSPKPQVPLTLLLNRSHKRIQKWKQSIRRTSVKRPAQLLLVLKIRLQLLVVTIQELREQLLLSRKPRSFCVSQLLNGQNRKSRINRRQHHQT